MRKISYFLILVTFLLVFAASCSQQQEESVSTSKTAVVSNTNKVVETQTSPTIEVTPTATYIPKKAEGFENCETTIYKECDFQGYDNIEVLHENSYLVLEIDGIRTIIGESEIINGTTYFTVNGVKISVTSGTVMFLYFYTKNTDTGSSEPEYMLAYSPDSNEIVEQTHLGYVIPPYVYIKIFKDSTITVPTYQEGYCIEQLKYFYSNHPDEEKKQCAIGELPSGDQYGWGINKYGEIVCPQIWIEETETE